MAESYVALTGTRGARVDTMKGLPPSSPPSSPTPIQIIAKSMHPYKKDGKPMPKPRHVKKNDKIINVIISKDKITQDTGEGESKDVTIDDIYLFVISENEIIITITGVNSICVPENYKFICIIIDLLENITLLTIKLHRQVGTDEDDGSEEIITIIEKGIIKNNLGIKCKKIKCYKSNMYDLEADKYEVLYKILDVIDTFNMYISNQHINSQLKNYVDFYNDVIYKIIILFNPIELINSMDKLDDILKKYTNTLDELNNFKDKSKSYTHLTSEQSDSGSSSDSDEVAEDIITVNLTKICIVIKAILGTVIKKMNSINDATKESALNLYDIRPYIIKYVELILDDKMGDIEEIGLEEVYT